MMAMTSKMDCSAAKCCGCALNTRVHRHASTYPFQFLVSLLLIGSCHASRRVLEPNKLKHICHVSRRVLEVKKSWCHTKLYPRFALEGSAEALCVEITLVSGDRVQLSRETIQHMYSKYTDS